MARRADRLKRAALAAPATRALAFKLRLLMAFVAAVVVLVAMTGFALIGVIADAQQARAGGPAGLSCETSRAGAAEIPSGLLAFYARAAEAYGLGGRGVFVLAAINRVETDFGRGMAVSSAGATGWMQFMPDTWARYGVDGNGDGRQDPADPGDAIPAAGNYLRVSGAPGDWYGAVFAYNHADWYVRQVLDLADRYQGSCVLVGEVLAAAGRGLAWPTTVRTVTGVFGEQRPGHRHQGLDIAAPEGAPVTAAAAGVVALAQSTAESGGYGNYLCLQHGPRQRTCYAHLAALYVTSGQTVGQGEVVGTCGNTGRSFGAHLHFEVRLAPGWRAVDPLSYLSPTARAGAEAA